MSAENGAPILAVSVKTAAKMLETYPEKIRDLVESGDLEMVWVGSRKIVVRSMEDFLEREKTSVWESEGEIYV